MGQVEAAINFFPLTLTGEEAGVPVQLERNGGIHTFTTTAFIQPALSTTCVITDEGVTGAIAHLLGFHDVEIGDAEFDRAFRLVSKDADALKRILGPGPRTALQKLASEARGFGSRFQVTDNAVTLTRAYFGPMTMEETLLDIPLVVGVVRAFKDAAAS